MAIKKCRYFWFGIVDSALRFFCLLKFYVETFLK